MDQNKNQGQPNQDRHPNQQTQGQGDQDDQDHNRGQGTSPSHGTQKRDPGKQGERNSSSGGGISNRGMDRELYEQDELPERGSDQSDR